MEQAGDDPARLNVACQDLLAPEIPAIHVLLADPDGEAFLHRLDVEGATAWKLWRVRKQVLRFALGLLETHVCVVGDDDVRRHAGVTVAVGVGLICVCTRDRPPAPG